MALEVLRGVDGEDGVIRALELHDHLVLLVCQPLHELSMALPVLALSFLVGSGLLVDGWLTLGGGGSCCVISRLRLALRFYHF